MKLQHQLATQIMIAALLAKEERRAQVFFSYSPHIDHYTVSAFAIKTESYGTEAQIIKSKMIPASNTHALESILHSIESLGRQELAA